MDIVSYILASRKAASATSGIASIESQNNNLIFNMNDGNQFIMPLNIPEIQVDRNVTSTSSNPVQSKGIVEWGEAFLDPIESLIVGSNVVLDDGTTITVPSAYAKAVEQGYTGTEEEFYSMLAAGGTGGAGAEEIEIGTEATSEDTKILINPDGGQHFNVPEIKDNEINEYDTWSSQKINNAIRNAGIPIVECRDEDDNSIIYELVEEAYLNNGFCILKTDVFEGTYIPLFKYDDTTHAYEFCCQVKNPDEPEPTINFYVKVSQTGIDYFAYPIEPMKTITLDTEYDEVLGWYSIYSSAQGGNLQLKYVVPETEDIIIMPLTCVKQDTEHEGMEFIFSAMNADGYFYAYSVKNVNVQNDVQTWPWHINNLPK